MTDLAHISDFSKKRVKRSLEKNPEIKSTIVRFQKRADFDIKKLSSELGVPVYDLVMPEDLGGFLYPGHSASGWVIYINPNKTPETIRWVIAHELSHYIIDKECKPPTVRETYHHPCFTHRSVLRETKYMQLVVRVERYFDGIGERLQARLAYADGIDETSVMLSEEAADWLAGWILIPSNIIRKVVEKNGSVRDLAHLTQTSTGVARAQIKLFQEHRRISRQPRLSQR
jgi:Zn-dependent peptidase ImmA (M78 family)